MTRHASQSGRGFSLIEVTVCVLIVAGLFVAVMHTVGATRRTRYVTDGRSIGALLGRDLMSEILQQAYEDREAGGGPLGVEVLESSSTRADFDDVDDYANWTATPPQLKDGTPLTRYAGWARKVEVRWVSPSTVTQVQSTESNTKRIKVQVHHNGVLMAEAVAVRTRAFPDLQP